MRSSSGNSVSPARSFDSDDNSVAEIGATSSTYTSALRTHSRRCGFPECQKTAKRGGLCISHGGGKKCAVKGCTTSVVSRGFCVAHGGGKRCQAQGCTKSAQTGGFCWIHGGGKKCGYQGCKKRAQSGGACISHGGGKRCRMEGCNKVVQYDGLCVGHGGYRKCLSLNCDKRALANSYCQAHGGNSICHITDCQKRAIRGGVCSEHKAQLSPKPSVVFARCRPSIDLPETLFKVEPTEVGGPGQDQSNGYHTPVYTNSTTPATYTPSSDLDMVSFQYVRQGSSSLLDGRTMVTPISKCFNAGKSYDPFERKNVPVLPSFQTLQRSCSSSPWSEGSNMD
ncbi:WRKY transcription factor 19 [Phytophthora nicotianae]|uniref:WRKY transcription factor 19 n=1 Tax=Phytophthora nicotianae TaxID=4792 RepID=A0A0W8DKC5_PHYNI|nr:WRKY transcription factor 19 [Phytophthora nicotianae]